MSKVLIIGAGGVGGHSQANPATIGLGVGP